LIADWGKEVKIPSKKGENWQTQEWTTGELRWVHPTEHKRKDFERMHKYIIRSSQDQIPKRDQRIIKNRHN
jgi:hypothetical protein